MKFIFTLLLVFTACSLSAQWNNTTNEFYDSLHNAVCTAVGEQVKSIVVKSYPDSGYFVVWEDHRRGFYANFQIFAQKYDKAGNQLWANDGVAISSGTNSQHFTVSSNNDYRNYSVAATDSVGGFYIAYSDDSVSSYVWERLTVQHIRNDGTTVFSGVGSILFTSDQANQNLSTQLISDGNGGFFISHLHAGYGTMDLFVYCFKDINGTLQSYGGGKVNENGVEIINTGYCGNYPTIMYPQTYVIDYHIYPDLQKGCNVVMEFSQNGYLPNTDNRVQLAYNWLWRVQKDTITDVTTFAKDDVVLFYKLNVEAGTLVCKNEVNQTVYTYATSKLISEGYLTIGDWVYGAERTKGTLIQTDGNINVNIFAVNEREYINSGLTDWYTRVFYRKQQKFESVPYEYTVAPYLPTNLNGINRTGQNKLGNENGKLNDTLLYSSGSSYYYDFSLASGGNKIFATAAMGNGAKNVLLQQMQVKRINADSFAVQLNTAKQNGILIGKEVNTGFTGTEIHYNDPQVKVDKNGVGLFYILESGRSTRVSPIFTGAVLAWGAMGKSTGTGHFNGYYNPEQPYFVLDPINGKGLLGWTDQRTPPSTSRNIYMRHLDKLNEPDYFPPNYVVKKIINPYGATIANPVVMAGSSKKYTVIEAYSGYSGNEITTPVAEILDNYNLGSVSVSMYQNTGPIRKYNGTAYLDRNYTITPENNPAGAATINVRLFFTQEEFDALKLADPSISSPGDLVVIKQPATGSAPASFIFVAGEQTVVPQSWATVPGGYYIEIAINSFSNFFIQKANGALPVQWLNMQAIWLNNSDAKITWQVAQELNVKDYNVMQSVDGINFFKVCTVVANHSSTYQCIAPGAPNVINYYRVQQTDLDGKSTESNVVMLKSSTNRKIYIYPNPAKDNVFIRNDLDYRNMVLTDLEGKVILKKTIFKGLNSVSIKQLPAGSYLIRLFDRIKGETLKFVKE